VTTPLLLAVFAVAMATVVPWAVRRSAWTGRAPALGILAWQAVSASVLIAATLVGVALALPTLPITTDFAEWVGACSVALREQYATPGGAAIGVCGAVVAASIVVRFVACLAVGWVRVSRARRRLRGSLGILAKAGTQSGVLVVEHPRPGVYCVPGRGGSVVVTSGAIGALDEHQLAAALAHERAHLGDRHDLVLVMAAALRRAFGIVPVFRWAEAEIRELVEMRADDQALGSVGRRALATALVVLAGARHPAGTLGMGGSLAATRVRRLAVPDRSLGVLRSVVTVLACLTALAVPLAVAAGPAVTAAAMDYCPVVFPG
jgi:Zn-dependent protease with chaperone function